MADKPLPRAYQLLPLFEREWPKNPHGVRERIIKYAEHHAARKNPFTAQLYYAALAQLEQGKPLSRMGDVTDLPRLPTP